MKRGFKSQSEKKSLHLRKSLGLKKNDPIDPFEIARSMDITVISAKEMVKYGMDISEILRFDGEDKYSFSAVTISSPSGKFIIYNPYHSKRRTKSNLTHEIAHIICEHDFSKVDYSNINQLVRDFPEEDEKEADWLTGALLIPREGLVWAARRGMELEEIASHFETTLSIARWRFYQTGVSKQMAYIYK